MTKRQEAHRREREARKARLIAEPDSEWAKNYRAKRTAEQKKWYEKNPGAKRRHDKTYAAAHRDALRIKARDRKRACRIAAGIKPRNSLTKQQRVAYRRKWFAENRARINAQRKARRATNPAFKIACNLRKRLSTLLRMACARKTTQTLRLLGCPLDSFMLYIESKFELGMTWENYGAWHIDHIVPCAIFDLTKHEHQKRCFHFSNMQPMWALDNRRKSDSVTEETRIRFTV